MEAITAPSGDGQAESRADASALMANRILAQLPEVDRDRLLSEGRICRLVRGTVLAEPNRPIQKAHFPLDAVCSMIAVMGNGVGVEAAMFGREGMTAVPLALGEARIGRMRVFCQVGGEAFEIGAGRLAHVMEDSRPLRDALRRFVLATFMQAAQSAACNRLHSIEERCARWLLMAHDRVDDETLELTQEFLAEMLGIRRPSVTVAAGILQKAGFIEYHRGQVTVVDRNGLEGAACECYATIVDEYERLGLSAAGA